MWWSIGGGAGAETPPATNRPTSSSVKQSTLPFLPRNPPSTRESTIVKDLVAANRSLIEQAFDRGYSRWPDVSVSLDAFAARAAALQVDDDRLGRHGDDLFLVTGVLLGLPAAIQHFDSEFIAVAASVARRVDRRKSFVDDVAQELRLKLLTGDEPRLRKFSCAGSLTEWLRVSALRTALNLRRSDRLIVTEEFHLNVGLVGDGPDDAPIDGIYQDDFQKALEFGFHRLAARERTLLRLHFVDRLSIDRLAVMYGVHRATVARWLVTIRNQLFSEAKGHLAANHGFNTAEVKSLYRHLEGRVHITISRILRPGAS